MKCFEKADTAKRELRFARALPLAKLRVGHVAVDCSTTLKFLLLELQTGGELTERLKFRAPAAPQRRDRARAYVNERLASEK